MHRVVATHVSPGALDAKPQPIPATHRRGNSIGYVVRLRQLGQRQNRLNRSLYLPLRRPAIAGERLFYSRGAEALYRNARLAALL